MTSLCKAFDYLRSAANDKKAKFDAKNYHSHVMILINNISESYMSQRVKTQDLKNRTFNVLVAICRAYVDNLDIAQLAKLAEFTIPSFEPKATPSASSREIILVQAAIFSEFMMTFYNKHPEAEIL
jgi:Cdc6-like AAA superfamily ATPase